MNLEILQMREWEPDRRMPGLNLSDADRSLATSLSAGEGRLRVTELPDAVRFDASAWVGVVRFTGLEVRIVPKLVGENLGVLQMIEYSSGLGALARLDSARTLATARDGSLVDLLALLLAEASLDIAKHGILQDYVVHEEALKRMRGRLLPYEQVTRHYGQIEELECRFDELEGDILENRILAAALGIARRVASDFEVRRSASRAHAIFSEVADEASVSFETPDPDYNRRNEHYRPAHVLARLFLRSLAVNDMYSPGSGESFAFLLDMNLLFEGFVTRLLADAFRGTPVSVHPQKRDRTLIWDARTGKPYAAVIPDILLERKGNDPTRLPVDAKYKLYDERKIDQADIYQTFFYAWAYANTGSTAAAPAFILYPGDADAPGTILSATAHGDAKGAVIRAIPIDVPRCLTAIRQHERPAIPQIASVLFA